MHKIKCVLLFMIALAPAAFAAAPPSDASIQRLLQVTETRKLLDHTMNQLDGMMANAMREATANQPVSASQQKAIDRMRSKMVALFKQEMRWEEMESLYLRIYREAFTQEEVNGMLAFYGTPAGQAVIRKMPLVMQHTMSVMQQKMSTLMPKLAQLQNETLHELKAESKAEATSQTGQ
jgi:uncharacterized protein